MLASEGVIFSDGFFKTFQVAYLRIVEDTSDEFAMILEYGTDIFPQGEGDNIQAKSRFYASYIYNFSKP